MIEFGVFRSLYLNFLPLKLVTPPPKFRKKPAICTFAPLKKFKNFLLSYKKNLVFYVWPPNFLKYHPVITKEFIFFYMWPPKFLFTWRLSKGNCFDFAPASFWRGASYENHINLLCDWSLMCAWLYEIYVKRLKCTHHWSRSRYFIRWYGLILSQNSLCMSYGQFTYESVSHQHSYYAGYWKAVGFQPVFRKGQYLKSH